MNHRTPEPAADREHRRPEDEQAGPGCRAQPSLHLAVADHPQGVRTEEAAAVLGSTP